MRREHLVSGRPSPPSTHFAQCGRVLLAMCLAETILPHDKEPLPTRFGLLPRPLSLSKNPFFVSRLISGAFKSMSSIDEQLSLSVDIFALCSRSADAPWVGLLIVLN